MSLTEDITIPSDKSWVNIQLTSTQTIIGNYSNIPLRYRLGASSTSVGMIFKPNDIITIDQDIYIQSNTRREAVIVVTR